MTKAFSVGLLGGLGLVLGIGGAPDAPTGAGLKTQTQAPPPALDLADIEGLTPTPAPGMRGASTCPNGMVEVQGDYCPSVEQKCLRWLDPDTMMRCAEFAPTGDCGMRTSHKHFCIDRYEYPNSPGTKPAVMVSWNQAREACSIQGKRLCGEQEWTLACEGSERLPYPYGYARSPDACNIDRPHPEPDERKLADPRTRDAEVARLDQRDPSGAHDACVSPFGVYDMTGNVDEWVVNPSGRPYKSGLKGGYWGPVRDRCRPMTIAHDENFAFYQIGFRCCADPGTSVRPAPVARSAAAGEVLAGS
ncbi:MAG TPA: SUMF1/EgtB/PvdO family nonheme iron enzyme [Polyangiaceae bacterium]|nr:SUMF1/EgtB/PvdO family nonheme iron enzyme [Polyangiaceae bacterium]